MQSDAAVKRFRNCGALVCDGVLLMVVDVAIALHLVTGGVWWWFSPKGFPVASSQFWTNSVLPVAALAIAFLGLVAMHYKRRQVAAATILCFTMAWATAAITSRIEFPISLAGIWLLFFLVAGAGALIFILLVQYDRRLLVTWIALSAFGATVGVLVVWGQISEPPSTIPWNTSLPPAFTEQNRTHSQSVVPVAENADFFPGAALLTLKHDNIRIRCSPLIEFDRISPDRFWSLLSPRGSTRVRHYLNGISVETALTFHYHDRSSVFFPKQTADGALELTAFTAIESATYSHLNTFCYLEVGGHESLALSFSPCLDTIVEVLPADYPFGRPARFAYLDADGKFYVCEATSGEKGPFRELASGPLKRGQPLTIYIYDNERQMASIQLEDWSAQASTAISPSAGWGVPVNAIEFHRLGDNSTESAGIWITLAATAIGRGFETVGHQEGTYRSKIKLRKVTATEE